MKVDNLKINSAPSEELRLIEEQSSDEKQVKLKEALDHLTQTTRDNTFKKIFSIGLRKDIRNYGSQHERNL